jgi:hypothetical protein
MRSISEEAAMKGSKQRVMTRHTRSSLTAALLAALGVLLFPGGSPAEAAPTRLCDMRLQVELTPDVPNPGDVGFISSLLGNHPDFRLTLQRQDPETPSVITLDLTGPGSSAAGCDEVLDSMRKDARVMSIEVRREAAATAPAVTTRHPRGVQAVSAVQSMGTVQAGPDGDWVLKRSSGVSYAQQAHVRYECDIWAVDETGFDPTEDDGGVPPDEVAAKRTDYLQAEAACFKAHGYLVR